MIRIEMPWPPKGLSPNARKHWAQRNRLAQPYRLLGRERAKAAMRGVEPFAAEPLAIAITFHPPDRRARDDDNMIGAFKAGRDGIADGLAVNDKLFRPTYRIAEPVRGGKVVVECPWNSVEQGKELVGGSVGHHRPPEWLTR